MTLNLQLCVQVYGLPQQGDKLSVSGKLVFDNGKEKWHEIHPATDIKTR
jgi:hypothetical protein